MGPELHLQMIAHRTTELREQADNYRLAREAQEDKKDHSPEKRRRGLFGKIIPA
ncbi:hypothetical protein [Streptosporangium sp. NBC_01469]|uniref:hypothetical protein n=1 Tax=Streptosporangium sp. NBC_01469 TaxID=2903898 RepID=UPI002E2D3704|nr:hypothetical protein [Streptosporangium sp. NBC_01469]